jgi:hypothetical protein
MRSLFYNDMALTLTVTAVVALIGFAIYASIQEEHKWDQFKSTHECTIVGKTAARMAPGFSSKGTFVTTEIPATTTWRCNDGVDYTR